MPTAPAARQTNEVGRAAVTTDMPRRKRGVGDDRVRGGGEEKDGKGIGNGWDGVRKRGELCFRGKERRRRVKVFIHGACRMDEHIPSDLITRTIRLPHREYRKNADGEHFCLSVCLCLVGREEYTHKCREERPSSTLEYVFTY